MKILLPLKYFLIGLEYLSTENLGRKMRRELRSQLPRWEGGPCIQPKFPRIRTIIPKDPDPFSYGKDIICPYTILLLYVSTLLPKATHSKTINLYAKHHTQLWKMLRVVGAFRGTRLFTIPDPNPRFYTLVLAYLIPLHFIIMEPPSCLLGRPTVPTILHITIIIRWSLLHNNKMYE